MYKYTADANEKNWFEIEKFLNRKMKLIDQEEYILFEEREEQ